MKLLALLLVAGAASIHGSAFFGLYTAPGLEEFPTYAELQGPELDEVGRPVEESGIFPITSNEEWLPWGVTRVL